MAPDPRRIVIDARNVERFTGSTQDLQVPAWQREKDGHQHELLRQTAQLRACYERLRERFPSVEIDIFVCQQHYLQVQEDENIVAIRERDPCSFHKVPGGQDVDRMLLARALDLQDAVVVSNDLFRDHVSSGLVSQAWVNENVWGFMFARGELVLPQLAAPAKSQLTFNSTQAQARPMRHVRLDNATAGTGLRPEPDVASLPSQQALAVDGEEVRVLAQQSEHTASGCATWAKVSCAAGQGWLQKSHLAPLLTKGERVRHVRADNPEGPTMLREDPDAMALPSSALLVQPEEEASALQESGTWVQVSCAAGKGWLKRIHLQEAEEPPVKRQRLALSNDTVVQHIHIKSLGYGESAEPHVQALHSLLALHDITVQQISVGERPPPPGGHPPACSDSAKQGGGDVTAQSMPATVRMGPPPLARWYVRDAALQGPEASLEALRSGALRLRVDGLLLEVSAPLDPNSRRRGRGPTSYSERLPPTPVRAVASTQAKSVRPRSSVVPTEPANSQVPSRSSLATGPPASQAPMSQACPPPRSSMVPRGDCGFPCSQAPRSSLAPSADVPCSQAF